MKHLLLFFFSLLLFLSCSTEKEKTISKTKFVKTKQVSANRLLDAEISGMVCKMGCGASIRKEMLATKAVESCEIDYEDDRETNRVKIAFDKEIISADELISKINSMNDKQFKVISSESKQFESKNKSETTLIEEKPDKSTSESKLKISEENDFNMPNLLSLFSKLITG